MPTQRPAILPYGLLSRLPRTLPSRFLGFMA